MAAGKTTVGRLLAAQLGWQFIDVDAEIEAAAGKTVAELFQMHGEAWFREQERETIARLIASELLVLALGGGAIEDDSTRELLLSGGTHLVFLDASLETTLARCGVGDGKVDLTRPVLADMQNLEARYQRRLPLYRQSHQTVQVDALKPSEVVASVLRQVEGTLPS
jgi:shikimate kinase